MAPKLFKIKKAEQVAEDDNALVISDYQQQRLEQQTRQAEVQRAEEARLTAKAEDGTKPSVKVEGKSGDSKTSMSQRVASQLANNASGRAAASGPTPSAVVTYNIADVLPINTMDMVLGAPSPADSNHYQPMMLNPHVDTSKSPTREDNNDCTTAAAAASSSTTLTSQPPIKSGTAFLEESHREKIAAYAANKEFFDSHGQGPFANTNRSNNNNNNGSSEVLGVDDDSFMLLQLPRTVKELASSCSLDQMAPGRVGKLTVYKSGRTLMTIGGVTVDVSFEPHRQTDGGNGGGASSTGATAAAEGISQYAVAVDGSDLARRGCYQMCWIPRKVVCAPVLEDEQ